MMRRYCDRDAAVAADRVTFVRCVGKFDKQFNYLMKLITHDNDREPNCFAAFPPPNILSKAFFVAYHVATKGEGFKGQHEKDWQRLKHHIEKGGDFVFDVTDGYANAQLLPPETCRSESSSSRRPSPAMPPLPPPPSRPPPGAIEEETV